MLRIKHHVCAWLAISVLLVCVFPLAVYAQDDSSTTSASAEVPDEIKNVIDLAAALPDEDAVTIEHKAQILQAKRAYDALDRKQRPLVGTEGIGKINAAMESLDPLLLADLVARIEALPKKVSKADEEVVREIYSDYLYMSDDARSVLQEGLTDKMTDAVKLVAPELLGGADESGFESGTQTTDGEDKKAVGGQGSKALQGWQFVIIIVVAVFFTASLSMLAYLVILMIQYHRLTR